MSGDEIDIVMKAWNWWHPNTGDANQFRKSNPEYDKILKKSGINFQSYMLNNLTIGKKMNKMNHFGKIYKINFKIQEYVLIEYIK